MKTTINLVKPVMITPPTSLMKTWTITLACLFGAFGSAVNASGMPPQFDPVAMRDLVVGLG